MTKSTTRARTLKLVQTKPAAKTSSAPRLRAGIIEGTHGKDAGPYPKLPTDVQRAIDRKARKLADEAFDVIRESLVRSVGSYCFYGLNHERFEAGQALQRIAEATLDTALTPLVRMHLGRAHSYAAFLVHSAQEFQDGITAELRRFDQPGVGGNVA